MEYNHTKRTITTERLCLRLFQKSDAEAVQRIKNNYNIYKSTLNLPYPYTLDDALNSIENHEKNFEEDRVYEFAITDKTSGILYGSIALSNNQRFKHGEIAYCIGEQYWGKGYGTEAAKAIVQFAFKEKKLHKVFARYFKSNPASGRIMEKIGMVHEGILKDHIIKDGKYEDLVYYGKINPYEE